MAAAAALATPTEPTLCLGSASCLCELCERRLPLPAPLPVVVGGRVAPSGRADQSLVAPGAEPQHKAAKPKRGQRSCDPAERQEQQEAQ